MSTKDVRQVSVSIDRPAREVYDFASRPENWPRWARGLAQSFEKVDGEWVADSPMGKAKVRFAEPNAFGVLDHDVTLESGETVHNPLRIVVRDARRSEVVFTVFRRAGVTDAQFEADTGAVERDLLKLKDLVE